MSSIDEKVLADIDQLLTKLNEKISEMVRIQFWLLSFKDDVKKIDKTPGVI